MIVFFPFPKIYSDMTNTQHHKEYFFCRIMWGLFSKDPSKDFPYESGEQLGQIHLANKTVWSLHRGKHR